MEGLDFGFEESGKQVGDSNDLPLGGVKGKEVEEKPRFGSEITPNLAHLIGQQTLDWIRGDLEGKPVELKQLGDDFVQKMNWYIGCTILAQYARIPALFDTLNQVSGKLLNKNVVEMTTDVDELTKIYGGVSREITQVMEFARRYVTQNKDLLADNSDFFDRSLFEKIKSLPLDLTKDYLTLFQIIDHKGHSVLKEIIEKYK